MYIFHDDGCFALNDMLNSALASMLWPMLSADHIALEISQHASCIHTASKTRSVLCLVCAFIMPAASCTVISSRERPAQRTAFHMQGGLDTIYLAMPPVAWMSHVQVTLCALRPQHVMAEAVFDICID